MFRHTMSTYIRVSCQSLYSYFPKIKFYKTICYNHKNGVWKYNIITYVHILFRNHWENNFPHFYKQWILIRVTFRIPTIFTHNENIFQWKKKIKSIWHRVTWGCIVRLRKNEIKHNMYSSFMHSYHREKHISFY